MAKVNKKNPRFNYNKTTGTTAPLPKGYVVGPSPRHNSQKAKAEKATLAKDTKSKKGDSK